MSYARLVLWVIGAGVVLPAAAAPRETLPDTAIRGIEANPRVTFIVPWQRSRMQEFPLLPTHSALDDFYLPLSSQQLELDIKDGDAMPSQQPQ